MKHSSKKKARKITEEGDGPPPVKRAADEFDTAYFVAEATLNERPQPTSPAPSVQPPVPTAVPSKPLTPLAALWPSAAPSPAASQPSKAMPLPAAQSAKPPVRPEPAPSPGEAAAVVEVPMPPVPPRVKVTFVLLDPGAKHVSLGGDFNAWSPDATPLKRGEGGHWETAVELAPGRYDYKFVVDGRWITDPLAHEQVRNQHGTLNSVIEVRKGF